MISRERNLRFRNRLNEIFEQIENPQVTVIDDEAAGELFNLLNEQDFFALAPTPLNQFNINEMKRQDFFTKVISADINGVVHTVCFENLPDNQKEKFNLIQQAIFALLTVAEPKASIQHQDWRELLPEILEEK
jgi:hypothetical protein